MNKIEAKLVDRDKDGWGNVRKLDLGDHTSIESQKRLVGILRGAEKFLLLDIHACDQCVCFESIKVVEDIVIVGFGEYVYFIDVTNTTVTTKKMDVYFGVLYTPGDFGLQKKAFHVLAASATHLYRYTKNAEEVWRSSELGIDGVIVIDVSLDKIRISGEWGPPGGWEHAEVNLIDGTDAITKQPTKLR